MECSAPEWFFAHTTGSHKDTINNLHWGKLIHMI
jgi:hypothetical protein